MTSNLAHKVLSSSGAWGRRADLCMDVYIRLTMSTDNTYRQEVR